MSKSNVVIIATEGLTTDLLHESLVKNFNVVGLFIEPHEGKKSILKRRFKRLGFSKTFGQILFLTIALPLISNRKKRVREIYTAKGFSGEKTATDKIHQITSVHDNHLANWVNATNPDLIFINGTRILKNAFLSQIKCPIVNIHVGITPKYRGVHGGYWAKHNQEPELFGVTLHYVDTGIDTGKIIAQKTISTTDEDNFKTYPILQYVEGLMLFESHYSAILNKTTTPQKSLTEESHLYYHPTLFTYLFGKK